MFVRKILGAILLFFIIAISSPIWSARFIMCFIVWAASSIDNFLEITMKYIGDKLRVEDLENWVDGPEETERKRIESEIQADADL